MNKVVAVVVVVMLLVVLENIVDLYRFTQSGDPYNTVKTSDIINDMLTKLNERDTVIAGDIVSIDLKARGIPRGSFVCFLEAIPLNYPGQAAPVAVWAYRHRNSDGGYIVRLSDLVYRAGDVLTNEMPIEDQAGFHSHEARDGKFEYTTVSKYADVYRNLSSFAFKDNLFYSSSESCPVKLTYEYRTRYYDMLIKIPQWEALFSSPSIDNKKTSRDELADTLRGIKDTLPYDDAASVGYSENK